MLLHLIAGRYLLRNGEQLHTANSYRCERRVITGLSGSYFSGLITSSHGAGNITDLTAASFTTIPRQALSPALSFIQRTFMSPPSVNWLTPCLENGRTFRSINEKEDYSSDCEKENANARNRFCRCWMLQIYWRPFSRNFHVKCDITWERKKLILASIILRKCRAK